LFAVHITAKLNIYHQTRSKTQAFFPFAPKRSFKNCCCGCFEVAYSIDFFQIEAAFLDTNYTTFSYLPLPIGTQNISEKKVVFLGIFS